MCLGRAGKTEVLPLAPMSDYEVCGWAHPTQAVESVFVCAFEEQGARDTRTSAPSRQMQR